MNKPFMKFSITFIVGLLMSVFTNIDYDGVITYLLFVMYWEQLNAAQLKGDSDGDR